MNRKQVETFLQLQPQIKSAYDELSILSKKKPTDSLNSFKLKFINNMLSRANELLGNKYKPFPEEFTLFDEDDMPNNSDIVFILSHYLTSLERLRCDNIAYSNYDWHWVINGKVSDQTTNPKTLK